MVPECKPEWNREAIMVFSRLPSLKAADKPCPQLQPSLLCFFLNFHFRHQIQHYTGQLAKDTSTDLHSLSNGISTLSQSEQRQWRLQKERLHNDFTKALNSFQAAQRTAAQKEKETIKAAKKASGMGGIAGKYLTHVQSVLLSY